MHRQFEQHISYAQLTKAMPEYARIQHGQLEYYRLGQGSPIVLIPGYVTDVTSWNKQFLATLAEHHQVIVFNNRNVGGSYVTGEHYQCQDLAKDTHQLIHALHLKKPAVLGLSMGGMIAQQVAVQHPDDLGQLILINTAIAGKQSIRPSPSTEKLMLNMPTSKLGRYLLAIRLFFTPSQRVPMGLALIRDRFQPKKYTEINPHLVISQQRELLLHWAENNESAKKLSRLNLPTLILNGRADAVIPPANSELLAQKIHNAKIKRWENGGHAMIYQYPESIANAINNFIAQTK